jgi:hypothetical protein
VKSYPDGTTASGDGLPDEQQLGTWLAFVEAPSTGQLDHLHSWGHELLGVDDSRDRLVGGCLLRICRLERELRRGSP